MLLQKCNTGLLCSSKTRKICINIGKIFVIFMTTMKHLNICSSFRDNAINGHESFKDACKSGTDKNIHKVKPINGRDDFTYPDSPYRRDIK
jgi:hypothetical protein